MSGIFFLLLSFMILHSSCGNSDSKKIEAILSTRQNAFETKNLDLYLSVVSPNYQEKRTDGLIGIDDIKKNFMSNVSLFDTIEISSNDSSIYLQGDKALVVQKTVVAVKIDTDEAVFQLDERLGFEKIGGMWKITKESNADFLEGFVFGGKR